MSVQPENSKWHVAARSGQCAILIPSDGNFDVKAAGNVTSSSLTGCEFAPTVSLRHRTKPDTFVTVTSIHVQASVSDMPAWYDTFTSSLSSLEFPGVAVVAGDFNHNATGSNLPLGWKSAHPSTDLSGGTSQHQDNWMGR